jgi:hypothetical protein
MWHTGTSTTFATDDLRRAVRALSTGENFKRKGIGLIPRKALLKIQSSKKGSDFCGRSATTRRFEYGCYYTVETYNRPIFFSVVHFSCLSVVHFNNALRPKKFVQRDICDDWMDFLECNQHTKQNSHSLRPSCGPWTRF